MALKTRKQRPSDRGSTGMNLAEISMRNWVIRPGMMITDAPGVRRAAMTSLGIICPVATFAGTLNTTFPGPVQLGLPALPSWILSLQRAAMMIAEHSIRLLRTPWSPQI
ncbi:hypothetical protein V8F33_009946 [Rhypophila sp. PSN 637]